jgi:hypothetical protein
LVGEVDEDFLALIGVNPDVCRLPGDLQGDLAI